MVSYTSMCVTIEFSFFFLNSLSIFDLDFHTIFRRKKLCIASFFALGPRKHFKQHEIWNSIETCIRYLEFALNWTLLWFCCRTSTLGRSLFDFSCVQHFFSNFTIFNRLDVADETFKRKNGMHNRIDCTQRFVEETRFIPSIASDNRFESLWWDRESHSCFHN